MVRSSTKKKKLQIVFKCIYSECKLFYDSVLGFKRHISMYDHKLFFNNIKRLCCPIIECDWFTRLDYDIEIANHINECHSGKNIIHVKETAHKIKKAYENVEKTYHISQNIVNNDFKSIDTSFEENIMNDSFQNEQKTKKYENGSNFLNFEILIVEKDIIYDIFNFTFPNGVIRINDIDKPTIFFCGIPGCGKHFKSIMAYKYHCQNFLHSFFSLYDSFCRSRNIELEYEILRDIFCKKFRISDKFNFEGLFHHSVFSPDQSFLFQFSLNKDYIIRTKRPRKREMNITEYNLLFTDDFSVTDFSDQFDSLPSKISFRGIKYDSLTKQSSHFKFINLKEQITASDRLKSVFCIATKKYDHKELKIFDFYTEQSKLFFFENREIIKEIHFDTGFIRQIIIQDKTTSLSYFCLMNDGYVRYFKNDEMIYKFNTPEVTNFILIDNYRQNEIVICDGFFLYKYTNNTVSVKSTRFEFPILSIVGKTFNTQEIFILDANGRITFCDSKFRNEQEIHTNIGTTNICYLNDLEALLICDSFLGSTKLMYLKDKNRKLTILSTNFSFCSENHNKSIIIGTYDGQVSTNLIANKNKITTENIFKFIRRKDHYILCCEEKELAFFSTQVDTEIDLSSCVIYVYHINNYFAIGLSNGFVLFVDT